MSRLARVGLTWVDLSKKEPPPKVVLSVLRPPSAQNPITFLPSFFFPPCSFPEFAGARALPREGILPQRLIRARMYIFFPRCFRPPSLPPLSDPNIRLTEYSPSACTWGEA